MRGSHDVLEDIEADLRNYPPLVDLLPSEDAIYIGHPAEDRDFMASVTLTTVYDGSDPHRGAVTRTYRVQATVKVTREWREAYDSRESQPAGVTQMSRILTHVADRLDTAQSATGPEIPLGGEGGPTPEELDDGRLAMTGDWRLSGTYLD